MTSHFASYVHNHVTWDRLLIDCFTHVSLKHDSRIKQCFSCFGVTQMINRECAKPFCLLFLFFLISFAAALRDKPPGIEHCTISPEPGRNRVHGKLANYRVQLQRQSPNANSFENIWCDIKVAQTRDRPTLRHECERSVRSAIGGRNWYERLYQQKGHNYP